MHILLLILTFIMYKRSYANCTRGPTDRMTTVVVNQR